jgi:hypothetical protein
MRSSAGADHPHAARQGKTPLCPHDVRPRPRPAPSPRAPAPDKGARSAADHPSPCKAPTMRCGGHAPRADGRSRRPQDGGSGLGRAHALTCACPPPSTVARDRRSSLLAPAHVTENRGVNKSRSPALARSAWRPVSAISRRCERDWRNHGAAGGVATRHAPWPPHPCPCPAPRCASSTTRPRAPSSEISAWPRIRAPSNATGPWVIRRASAPPRRGLGSLGSPAPLPGCANRARSRSSLVDGYCKERSASGCTQISSNIQRAQARG